MIFSRKDLDTAHAYISTYFNKILFVDTINDQFSPVKVSSNEWYEVPKNISFTEWVKRFTFGPYYLPVDDLSVLGDISYLQSIDKPVIIFYKKLISGSWHDVQLELYPVPTGTAYLFVRDLTKIKEGVDFNV